MTPQAQPPVQPPEDTRSEINKLGSGQPIDHKELWEQMDEDRMDRLLENLGKPTHSAPNGP